MDNGTVLAMENTMDGGIDDNTGDDEYGDVTDGVEEDEEFMLRLTASELSSAVTGEGALGAADLALCCIIRSMRPAAATAAALGASPLMALSAAALLTASSPSTPLPPPPPPAFTARFTGAGPPLDFMVINEAWRPSGGLPETSCNERGQDSRASVCLC
jgi:hypothetical protein